MVYVCRSVLTVFLLAGLGLNVFTQFDGGTAAASTQNGLTSDAQVYANACQTALQSYDHDFAPNVSVSEGCACLAREMSDRHVADLAAAEVLLVGIIAEPLHSAAPDWAGIAAQAGISDTTLGALLQASYAAVGLCGQSSTRL